MMPPRNMRANRFIAVQVGGMYRERAAERYGWLLRCLIGDLARIFGPILNEFLRPTEMTVAPLCGTARYGHSENF
jgi:hypothetical protein